MGSVVRKITRPVKKAVKSVAKIAKSPVGQIGLSIAVPQLSFMRGIGAGLSPFAAGALRSGITSGIISGLSGRGLDPRSLLTSAVIGGGLSRFGAGRAAQFGESDLVDQRFLGTPTDPAEQLVQSVQPENIVPSNIQQISETPTFGMGDVANIATPAQGNIFSNIELDPFGSPAMAAIDTSRIPKTYYYFPGDDPTLDFLEGGIDAADRFDPSAIQPAIVPSETARLQQAVVDQNIFKKTGKEVFQIKDNIRPIFERIKAGEIKSALDLTADVAKTNKLDLSLIGLSIAPLFAGQKLEQEEGESNIDFEKRRETVRGYLRQYGSKFYSGDELDDFINRSLVAKGGMPTGIMRTNAAGIKERDYRDEGGFVPVGIKEKADDVPAMLSKNEFVMTADAVRGAGNGSIEKGAQKMYDTMKELENRVA